MEVKKKPPISIPEMNKELAKRYSAESSGLSYVACQDKSLVPPKVGSKNYKEQLRRVVPYFALMVFTVFVVWSWAPTKASVSTSIESIGKSFANLSGRVDGFSKRIEAVIESSKNLATRGELQQLEDRVKKLEGRP